MTEIKRSTNSAHAPTRSPKPDFISATASGLQRPSEKESHDDFRPDDEFVDVEVRQVYTSFPAPYGLQRPQTAKLSEAWKWAARPLQPTKGNLQGQAWTVGASEPPPNKVMPGFGHDVLITLQKVKTLPAVQRPLAASNRTRRFLKEGQQAIASSSNQDPWFHGLDPWSSRQKSAPAATSTTPASASRFAKIQDTIQVQQAPPGLAPPDDVERMEVNIAELQAQGNQFQQWFHEARQRMSNTEAQLGQLRQVVEHQGQVVTAQTAEIQQDVGNKTQILQNTLQGSVAAMSNDLSNALENKLTSQFDRFEAMLAKKKSRSE